MTRASCWLLMALLSSACVKPGPVITERQQPQPSYATAIVVVTADGQPVSGAAVYARPVLPGATVQFSTTDSNGRTAATLPAGEYWLFAVKGAQDVQVRYTAAGAATSTVILQ